MLIEYGLLVTLIIAVLAAYVLLKTIKHLIVNTVLGLALLVAGNLFLGLHIAYTWVVIAICAIGGIAGAVVVILLSQLKIAF
jgi:hypothetical protein